MVRDEGSGTDQGRLTLITAALRLVTISVMFGLLSGAVSALIIESAAALATGSHPGASSVTIAAASVSLVVLTPLAYAKYRLGRRMNSRALQGDGVLSGIGAATSLLALAALVLYHALGWWWADRVAALIVAAVAATQAWRTAPKRS